MNYITSVVTTDRKSCDLWYYMHLNYIRTIWLTRIAKRAKKWSQFRQKFSVICLQMPHGHFFAKQWHSYIFFLIAHKVSKYVYIWGTTTCNYQRKNKSGICLESCYYCDEQLNCTEHVKNQMMNMFPWEHSFNTLFTVPCCLPVLLFTTSPSGFHETWRQRESLSRYKN